jgi:hypothetical protein
VSYRVGRKLGKTLYRYDTCIGYFDDAGDAKLACDALNAPDDLENLRMPPADGGPRLIPHGIPGWWQVWSGYICVALLTPEDVAPLREAKG